MPPSHRYATINVSDLVASVTDNCDSDPDGSVTIASVSSDEPDNGGSDGNTINHILIARHCQSVQLRKERMDTGNGRVYTITLTVTDSVGHVSTVTATVTGPHSQNGAGAIDDGPDHTVSGCP